ncbi:PREDICTED: uncharacterized protein LOC105563349 [Vollenhovia emeryi]|uniref:uncharacterized protein LOC105563349 n=1 Tax=Vollenhovia emeryi TaxID=411798 RepID=UPI0005F49F8B|nr:PREDICTED: uncharacterized protein LOC105563349 [Vollenhovia emeryi]
MRTHFYGGLNGENAPPCINEESLKKLHLRMTAHEMLMFVRSLSLLIGDNIPNDDQYWRLYLLLRKIIDVVMSPIVYEGLTVHLNALVKEHNELYVSLFGNLKPKHHFLTHYSRIMLNVGPLIHTWCMRFEAKHRQPKTVAKSTQSRKNILKTLAIKEQLAQSARVNFDMSDVQKFGKMSQADVLSDSDLQPFIPFLPASCQSHSVVVNFVKFKGVEYKVGSCVIITADEEWGQPCFGIVSYILLNEQEDLFLLLKVLKTDYFDDHLHSYKVSASTNGTYTCTSINELFCPHPVILNEQGSVKYVTVNYML